MELRQRGEGKLRKQIHVEISTNKSKDTLQLILLACFL